VLYQIRGLGDLLHEEARKTQRRPDGAGDRESAVPKSMIDNNRTQGEN